MKNEQDYGYFGKGTEGYMHYMDTYNECYPDADKNADVGFLGNISLSKLFLMLIFGYYALQFGYFFFEAFGIFVTSASFEMLLLSMGCGVASVLLFMFVNFLRKL